MSERDLLDGLNDSLSIEDLMRVPESQGLAEQDARLARLRGEPGAQERSIQAPDLDSAFERLPQEGAASGKMRQLPQEGVYSGKGSWYSQLPQYGWVDREDRPGSNALGVPDEKQGIALPSRATLGQWFDVTFPDGQTHRLQQTDVGPAKWTGKGIDISAAAAHEAGYSPKNFPTGGNFTWKPAAEGDLSYDTEDRTAVGLGGSRAYAPQVTTVPEGRRQMANGEPRGIMDFLTGGQQLQQPQGGLLGMLGDPETMSYIAMMLKGASPYSNLDPNAMLTNAHSVAMRKAALEQQRLEQARDNARADRALNLRESEYGLQREDRQAKRDLATSQQKRDAEAFADLTGRPQGAEAATGVPDPTADLSNDEKIRRIDQRLGQGGLSDAGEKQLLRLREQYSRGPSASTLKSIEKAENEIAPLQATKDKLEKMQSLLPNTLEGPLAGLAGSIGGRAGPFGSQQAKDTLEFNNLAEIETIRDMSRTMKGSTAVKEMDVWLRKAADPTLPKKIRQDNLNLAVDAVNRELATRTDRIKQLQEGTYGRKQTPKTEAPNKGEGGPKRLRYNPETGNFE